jgi:hypothetical protein
MAKGSTPKKDTEMSNEQNAAATEQQTQGTQNGSGTTDQPVSKADNRYIVLKMEGGTEVKRADYIRRRWREGASRSDIAKEVSKLQGQEVPYQIVFAATKGLAGGPPKNTQAPASTAAAEGQAAQQQGTEAVG